MTKEIVAAAVKELPPVFDLDELIERLIFIEKIEEGLKDVEEGRTIPLEEVEKIIRAGESKTVRFCIERPGDDLVGTYPLILKYMQKGLLPAFTNVLKFWKHIFGLERLFLNFKMH